MCPVNPLLPLWSPNIKHPQLFPSHIAFVHAKHGCTRSPIPARWVVGRFQTSQLSPLLIRTDSFFGNGRMRTTFGGVPFAPRKHCVTLRPLAVCCGHFHYYLFFFLRRCHLQPGSRSASPRRCVGARFSEDVLLATPLMQQAAPRAYQHVSHELGFPATHTEKNGARETKGRALPTTSNRHPWDQRALLGIASDGCRVVIRSVLSKKNMRFESPSSSGWECDKKDAKRGWRLSPNSLSQLTVNAQHAATQQTGSVRLQQWLRGFAALLSSPHFDSIENRNCKLPFVARMGRSVATGPSYCALAVRNTIAWPAPDRLHAISRSDFGSCNPPSPGIGDVYVSASPALPRRPNRPRAKRIACATGGSIHEDRPRNPEMGSVNRRSGLAHLRMRPCDLPRAGSTQLRLFHLPFLQLSQSHLNQNSRLELASNSAITSTTNSSTPSRQASTARSSPPLPPHRSFLVTLTLTLVSHSKSTSVFSTRRPRPPFTPSRYLTDLLPAPPRKSGSGLHLTHRSRRPRACSDGRDEGGVCAGDPLFGPPLCAHGGGPCGLRACWSWGGSRAVDTRLR
ncbi:uncharacterized protein BDZ99DRAFT_503876 [Mytilinidion resinicola]|uniref:Uncharacterized protein n=1 Tax=Mytilinidion resinicola TaxID=574789 RepID=A0A6A6Y1M4_9PEZI|nr:uncharacterized protein BDZ99DRAFT_503876 [Mytilinidion resinicola]KAF2802413.1 hypothetical protein BDZ99DRAFT_503876 [Mytilinidion resinicola]